MENKVSVFKQHGEVKEVQDIPLHEKTTDGEAAELAMLLFKCVPYVVRVNWTVNDLSGHFTQERDAERLGKY